MTDNTERFTGRAEDYHLYRQRYPAPEVLQRLRAWCGLDPNWLVADIGAGTGMLAEVFLEGGNRVLAIEPNVDMRVACERLRARWPQLEVIDAIAEATGLHDGSIDMVAAGRAFHWFDKQRAPVEFRRILKPGGWVALVSLGRSHDSTDSVFHEQIADFERLLIEHGTDYQYVRSGYRVHDNLLDVFGSNAEMHQERLPGTQQLDWPSFRGQMMSLSFVPREGHPNYAAFQRELRAYFDRHADCGVLSMPTTCYITAARL
jgi:ubiquinone/menaquinone biosynthesis C-methylase UbiE